jgi:hypothetical protein
MPSPKAKPGKSSDTTAATPAELAAWREEARAWDAGFLKEWDALEAEAQPRWKIRGWLARLFG